MKEEAHLHLSLKLLSTGSAIPCEVSKPLLVASRRARGHAPMRWREEPWSSLLSHIHGFASESWRKSIDLLLGKILEHFSSETWALCRRND